MSMLGWFGGWVGCWGFTLGFNVCTPLPLKGLAFTLRRLCFCIAQYKNITARTLDPLMLLRGLRDILAKATAFG